ncbi:S1-like domain-containing RNA-binding protein [uncultured Roseivirga sp.]|uniref:CvfB family protein n=1 Tax=uncultured Roseivirga sp. TaxID=543088 RepID=UPI000D7A20E1|nr:S1-like domain-containing RNA-binding protein [uncultured Roseivirga sp.]PWL31952.1 MAG: GntR family transcriptional regulator [Roseivirga sp. XM-24bin3]
MEIGKIQELEIAREVEFGCYLTDGKEEVLIPAKYLPEEYEIGDKIKVFVYTDHMSRPVAVTRWPRGQVGDIVGLEVKQVTEFGAFVDNGLEKDLLVPNKEQQADMKERGKYAVMILLDYKTNRMIGTTKIAGFLSDQAEGLEEGQQVKMVIWQRTDLGYKVVINGQFVGLIYNNEIFEKIKLGDNKRGYIKRIREDGKIDASLQKQGYEAVTDSSDDILQAIESNGGSLPLGDKSTPEEIQEHFGISKKNFKRVLGGLYKAGKIEIFDHEVRLKMAEG